MEKPFAKLYEDPTLGQILVFLTEDEEYKPTVKFFYQPEGLGVCSLALNFSNTEALEKYFEAIDQEKAIGLIEPYHSKLSSMEECK